MKKIKSEQGQIRLDSQRREFIKKSTLAGFGVAATVVLPTVALADDNEKNTNSKQQKGYQLSQHVIDYYKSAAS